MVDKVVMRIENCLVEGSYNNKKIEGMAIYEEGGSRENKEKQVEWNNKGYMGTERYGRDVVRKGGNKIMEERVPYIVELPPEEENKEEGIGEKQEVVIGRGDENEEGIVRGIMQLRLKKDVTEMEGEVMKVQNKRFKKMEMQEKGDMVSEGKEYREIWKVEEKEKKREVVEIRKRRMVIRRRRVGKKEMDRRLKINETDLWEIPVIMAEGLRDGRVNGGDEMMSGGEGFSGCPITATKGL